MRKKIKKHMNKIIKTVLIAATLAVGISAFGQSTPLQATVTPLHKQTWAQGVSLHAPKTLTAPSSTGQFSAQSTSESFDSSLFSLAYYFDRLPGNSIGGKYNMLALDVPGLRNPLNVGMATSLSGTQTAWSGLAVSYDLVKTSQLSFGLSLATPNFTLVNGVFSTASTSKFVGYPGVYFSYKL